jgi:hypothetical protein
MISVQTTIPINEAMAAWNKGAISTDQLQLLIDSHRIAIAVFEGYGETPGNIVHNALSMQLRQFETMVERRHSEHVRRQVCG